MYLDFFLELIWLGLWLPIVPLLSPTDFPCVHRQGGQDLPVMGQVPQKEGHFYLPISLLFLSWVVIPFTHKRNMAIYSFSRKHPVFEFHLDESPTWGKCGNTAVLVFPQDTFQVPGCGTGFTPSILLARHIHRSWPICLFP